VVTPEKSPRVLPTSNRGNDHYQGGIAYYEYQDDILSYQPYPYQKMGTTGYNSNQPDHFLPLEHQDTHNNDDYDNESSKEIQALFGPPPKASLTQAAISISSIPNGTNQSVPFQPEPKSSIAYHRNEDGSGLLSQNSNSNNPNTSITPAALGRKNSVIGESMGEITAAEETGYSDNNASLLQDQDRNNNNNNNLTGIAYRTILSPSTTSGKGRIGGKMPSFKMNSDRYVDHDDDEGKVSFVICSLI
jgi:hypothetical protein